MPPGLEILSIAGALFVVTGGLTSTDCIVTGADVVTESAGEPKTKKGRIVAVFFFLFFELFVLWVALCLSELAAGSCDGLLPKTVTWVVSKRNNRQKPTGVRLDCSMCVFLLQGWPTQ
jgi:hypothetical protein